ADLFEIVLARHPVGRFAYFLHGRQHQAEENPDDRDHYQQFDQGKAFAMMPHCAPLSDKGMADGIPPESRPYWVSPQTALQPATGRAESIRNGPTPSPGRCLLLAPEPRHAPAHRTGSD